MNVAYLNPFITSARNVFETMIKVPFRLGRPCLKQGDERLYKLFRLSTVIEMRGTINGIVVLHLTEGAALGFVTVLTGTPTIRLDPDVLDAVGEIGNMIIGTARRDLPPGEHKISTPKVMRPSEVVYPAGVPIIMIPADTGAGRFMLEIGLRTPTTSATPAAPAAATSAAPAAA
jgi:chemotaxis protein CheX